MASESSSIEGLPTDILSQILVRLPNIKWLCRAKLVCKSWFTLISSSEFIDLYNLRHKNNSLLVFTKHDRKLYGVQVNDNHVSKAEKIELPRYLNNRGITKIVASCHDLLLCIFAYSTLILLNPLTSHYHIIPRTDNLRNDSIIRSLLKPNYDEDYCFDIGLGYDHIKDDYKVVIFQCGSLFPINDILIYSIRDGSWEDECYFKNDYVQSSNIIDKPEVCLLYFIYQRKRIVTFNVCDGNWNVIPAPSVESDINHIGVLNGCLSVLEGGTKVWVVKEYTVLKSWVVRSWVLLLSVSDLYPIRASLASTPLAISTDNNEILLHFKDEDQWMFSCVWYNFKEKTTRKVQISPSDKYISLKSTFPITDISKFN